MSRSLWLEIGEHGSPMAVETLFRQIIAHGEFACTQIARIERIERLFKEEA